MSDMEAIVALTPVSTGQRTAITIGDLLTFGRNYSAPQTRCNLTPCLKRNLAAVADVRRIPRCNDERRGHEPDPEHLSAWEIPPVRAEQCSALRTEVHGKRKTGRHTVPLLSHSHLAVPAETLSRIILTKIFRTGAARAYGLA